MSTVSVAAHDGFGPGLSRAERTRQEKLWRARVRETIKSIPIPDDASVHDVIVCFDAAAEEVNLGRRITTAAALTKPVTPPTRAQGGGVMSPAKVRRSQAEAPKPAGQPVIPTLPPEFIPLVAASIPSSAGTGPLPFNGATIREVKGRLAKLAGDFGPDSAPYRRALLVASLRLAQAQAAEKTAPRAPGLPTAQPEKVTDLMDGLKRSIARRSKAGA